MEYFSEYGVDIDAMQAADNEAYMNRNKAFIVVDEEMYNATKNGHLDKLKLLLTCLKIYHLYDEPAASNDCLKPK